MDRDVVADILRIPSTALNDAASRADRLDALQAFTEGCDCAISPSRRGAVQGVWINAWDNAWTKAST
jgi:hypothetical protein